MILSGARQNHPFGRRAARPPTASCRSFFTLSDGRLSMRKIVLTFGLIAGAVLSAMMVVTLPFEHRFGNDVGLLVGYTTMVAASLLIYFGVRRYRDTVAGGRVRFGRALVVGLLIGA